ncbi:MAG: glutamate 5-kinase [Oscillospiraceae bacterium]|jgi:glutamate 5-kinase|nr:glutamate 5-kinase [Oscillospiraceae bacterium]
MTAGERIVIKIGTSTLTHESGLLNIRRAERLVKVLADLRNSGAELVLVSSGAIAIGAGKLGLGGRPEDMPTKQAAAAIGQCELMHIYDSLFSGYNHIVAQVLLTYDVLDDAQKKENALNTLNRLLDLRAIPIINENDTVSIDEMGIGDNDQLSAFVAKLIGADRLIILSDIAGLYTADPHTNPNAELISKVTGIDEKIRALAGSSGSRRGRGGMITKLIAAQTAMAAGIDAHIIQGENPENLYRLFDGEIIGTLFKAAGKREHHAN